MEGFVKFFGTGGARFVASRQTRATGGLWLRYRGTNISIDPGPGAVVRIHASHDHFDPADLDGIILTHKHLDHSNDVNIMIEAMTEGGFRKKGVLFCPEDAISGDPVVLKHTRDYVERVEILKERGRYTIKDINFTVPGRHRHGVETYGIMFHLNCTIGLISDTRFFPGLPDLYRADYLIINVLRTQPIEANHPVDHLSIDDFATIITKVKPKAAIMTHFGMRLIQEKPHLLAAQIAERTGVEVIAAHDGMKFEF
jgi:ribonuclease BN (tRNA processing enzyme)